MESFEEIAKKYCSFSKLTELKVLNLSDNNFSDGLPDVIGQLTSLNTLNLKKCKLSTLPVR